MGGAYGHIQHIYDDLNLTFGDVIKMLEGVAEGSVKATEKVDGLNIMVTISDLGPRFARNLTDIRAGGICGPEMLDRFEFHPVESTFKWAILQFMNRCEDIEVALAHNILKGRFLNIEIIDPTRPVTLPYDQFALIMNGICEVNDKGYVDTIDDPYALKSIVDCLKNDVIIGPINFCTTSRSNEFKNKLNSFVIDLGLNMNSSLRDYSKIMLKSGEIGTLQINNDVLNFAVDFLTNDPNCELSLVEIKRMMNSETALKFSALARSEKKMVTIGRHMQELARLLDGIYFDLVSDYNSCLVKDYENFSSTIIKKLKYIHELVKLSDDINVKNKFDAQVIRLPKEYLTNKNVLVPPLEGIVFEWNNSTYKMTGSYAALNQIFGIIRQHDR